MTNPNIKSEKMGKCGYELFALHAEDKVVRLSKLIVQAKKVMHSFVCVEDRYFDLIGSEENESFNIQPIEIDEGVGSTKGVRIYVNAAEVSKVFNVTFETASYYLKISTQICI